MNEMNYKNLHYLASLDNWIDMVNILTWCFIPIYLLYIFSPFLEWFLDAIFLPLLKELIKPFIGRG